MARVRFINNDGAGFANSVEVNESMTVADFLARQGITDASKYHIRYNGQECVIPEEVVRDGARISAVPRPGVANANDRVLGEGDRVSATPKRVAGAVLELMSVVFNDC